MEFPLCSNDDEESRREEAVGLVFANLAQECGRCAEQHGFYGKSPGEDIALFHSEISEALEEFRNGRPLNDTYYNPEAPTKPEGVPTELADVFIRILAFAYEHHIDLGKAVLEKMAYNESRPFRHGGKKL